MRAYRKKWVANNREQFRASCRKRRAENLEKHLEGERKKYWGNRENRLKSGRKYRHDNPDKALALVNKRKLQMLKRVPVWADLNAIREVYRQRREISELTGIPHSVDHIIPIQGRLVSGLHVHTNLRVIPTIENLSKNNRFNPGEFNA